MFIFIREQIPSVFHPGNQINQLTNIFILLYILVEYIMNDLYVYIVSP